MAYKQFYNFGTLLYKARWLVLLLALVAFAFCLPLVPKAFDVFTDTGFLDPSSQSAQADAFIKKHLDYQRNRFIIMYQSKQMFANNSSFNSAIKKSLAGLKNFSIPHEIIYPDANKKQVSKDKHIAYAIVVLKTNKTLNDETIDAFKEKITDPEDVTMLIGGEPIFFSDTNLQTKQDLIRAEYIATPVAIVILLLVFGSLIAALIPIILDGLCAVFILSILALVGNHLSLSVFTLNIALLLGLCLSLDYALFIISRFREELSNGTGVAKALAITQATAGKAVFFSGLAVFASLSALLMFPVNILLSVGVGGIVAVGVAMLVSILILPAILAVLHHKINLIPIKINGLQTQAMWRALVNKVVRYPWICFLAILIVLLFLGSPLLAVKVGISDYRILPKHLESRHVFDIFENQFSQNQLMPILVLVKSQDGKILHNP